MTQFEKKNHHVVAIHIKYKFPILVSLNLVFHTKTELLFFLCNEVTLKNFDTPKKERYNIIIFSLLKLLLDQKFISFCFSDSCIAKHNDGDKKNLRGHGNLHLLSIYLLVLIGHRTFTISTFEDSKRI